MSEFLEFIIAVVALWLVWRFVSFVFHPHQPAESADDPLSAVPVPRKRGPKGKSGAVALDEPDHETDGGSFPPRKL